MIMFVASTLLIKAAGAIKCDVEADVCNYTVVAEAASFSRWLPSASLLHILAYLQAHISMLLS